MELVVSLPSPQGHSLAELAGRGQESESPGLEGLDRSSESSAQDVTAGRDGIRASCLR